MSVFSPHPRGPRDRAVRLAVGGVLALAVVAVASAMLGTWLGLRGRGDAPQRGARGLEADPAAIAAAGPTAAAEGARGAGPRSAQGRPESDGDEAGRPEGSREDADDPELADDREPAGAGGDGPAPGRGPGAAQVLAFLDEFERQIDAAMARARESVVALEYTAGHPASGRRRIASGVVINARGDILSVRIDPPRSVPAPVPGSDAAAGRKGQKGREPTPIVARDYLGRRHAARWVAADPHTGLTLLRVSPRAVRPIRPATDGPKLGSQVFVLGNPFGMGHSVNRGHVAGLDRVLELGARQLGGLIQVQVPLYPGDSGAAVVDVRGGLLGLIRGGLALPGAGRPSPATDPGPDPGPETTATAPGPAEALVDVESDTDFGFAIPARDALWIADQLRVHGRVDRAYLGVRLEPMPVAEGPVAAPDPSDRNPKPAPSPSSPGSSWRGASAVTGPAEATARGHAAPPPAPSDPDVMPIPGDGARIREVVDGTPAARAGLRSGDRIVALDGQAIRSRNDLIDRLDRIPARTSIVLGVIRENDPARPRFEVKVPTASRSGAGQPGGGPSAAQAPAPASRSSGASIPVTPTASREEPPAPSTGAPPPPAPPAAPSPSSAPMPVEDRPGPGESSPATPRGDAPPSASPTTATAPPPQAPTPLPPEPGSAASFNELKLTLPREVVERIEHLERRINELEQVRAGARVVAGAVPKPGTGGLIGEREPRAPSRPAAPGPQAERAGSPSRPRDR